MKEKSYKMLTITDKDIKRDIPGIAGLCMNFSKDILHLMTPDIIRFMIREGYVLPDCATEEPQFERSFSVEGKHIFIFRNPEIRVYCRKYGERMIAKEIWFEFIHIK
jgi:hypothetical protein